MGLRATGVAACLCARHELFRPCGVVDMDKGERLVTLTLTFKPLTCFRYPVMDFVATSAVVSSSLLNSTLLLMYFFTYDIMCQWIKNLTSRHRTLPESMRVLEGKDVRGGIPKAHCPGHKLECQSSFSLNILEDSGHTDGEGIERAWSGLNKVAPSAKEMGPGSRHDTLDDHIGHHNWAKIKGMGASNFHMTLTSVINDLSRGKFAQEISGGVT